MPFSNAIVTTLRKSQLLMGAYLWLHECRILAHDFCKRWEQVGIRPPQASEERRIQSNLQAVIIVKLRAVKEQRAFTQARRARRRAEAAALQTPVHRALKPRLRGTNLHPSALSSLRNILAIRDEVLCTAIPLCAPMRLIRPSACVFSFGVALVIRWPAWPHAIRARKCFWAGRHGRTGFQMPSVGLWSDRD